MCAGFFDGKPKQSMEQATAALHNWIIYAAIGFFALFWAGFSIIIAVIQPNDWLGEIALFLCAPVTLAVGLGLIGYGLKVRNSVMSEIKKMEELGGFLRTYRRIKISELARKLGVNEFEAERTVGRCIDLGYVQGFVDRSAGEFVAREALNQVAPISGCPRCGAPPERIMLIGETNKCGACGAAYPVGPPPYGR